MTLIELSQQIHKEQVEKGFYDNIRSKLEFHMLIVSEISEATDAVTKNKPEYYLSELKPEGESVEIVDALIRILDYAGYRRWDLDKLVKEKLAYNKTRPYKHGKTL